MSEPAFIPQPGQVDYTNIRYAPCVDVIPTKDGKILLAKRAGDRRLYPGYWATADGFLDDSQSIEEKAAEELREELGMSADAIVELRRGQPILKEAPELGKTWIIIPVLATVNTDEFTLDWESSEARWFTPAEIKTLDFLPGMDEVIGQFFPEVLQ